MPAPSSLRLTTARLVLREASEEDLDAMHRVFTSDSKLQRSRPDIAAAGGYDLRSLVDYWESARLDSMRRVLVVDVRPSGETIGVVDFVTESPADGCPWIGLVLIHGDRQRRGFGSEALSAVAAYLTESGHAVVRMAVLEDNEVGLAFAHSLGFVEVADAPTPTTGRRALVMELDLAR